MQFTCLVPTTPYAYIASAIRRAILKTLTDSLQFLRGLVGRGEVSEGVQ